MRAVFVRIRHLAPAALALTLAAGGLVAAVPAAAGTQQVKASKGPLSATLAASGNSPKINTRWPINVTATLNGKPAAHASAIYEFLYDGVPGGAPQYPKNNKRYTFTGHFSDNIVFPTATVGQTLTLRVVVKDAGHTVNLDWTITSHA
jgi:hypothetical protein